MSARCLNNEGGWGFLNYFFMISYLVSFSLKYPHGEPHTAPELLDFQIQTMWGLPPGKNQSKLSPFLRECCGNNGLLFRLVCYSSPSLCTTSRNPGYKSSAIFGKGCDMRFILCCFDQDGGCGRSKRRKWIHHFKSFVNIIFLVALSDLWPGSLWVRQHGELSPRSHKVTERFWVL